MDFYPFSIAQATLIFLSTVLIVEFTTFRFISLRKHFILILSLCLLTSCAERWAMHSTPQELDVIQCQLSANREYVGVRLRWKGIDKYDSENMDVYLIDESTGEKYPAVRLQRIGRLAEVAAPGKYDVRHIMFRNKEGKLRVGTRVTVVVGSARRGNITLQ